MQERRRETIRRASRGVAAVSAVYAGIVAVLLVANLLQFRRVDVKESQAMDALVARLAERPGDAALREEIRTFDFVARRAYFSSRDALRLGSFLLFGGVVLFVASLRVLAGLERRIEVPDPPAAEASRRLGARRARVAMAATAVLLGAALITLSEISAAGLRTQPPRASGAAPVAVLGTAEWPAFRGPGGLGVAPAATPPTSWDVPAGRGVLWRYAVPLPGFSSPVVWKGSVYLSGSDGARREVYALDAGRGELRWRQEVRDVPGSPAQTPEVTVDTGHAAPSLSTDGERLFALFSNGDLAGFDEAGGIVWTRSLGMPDSPYGHASSLLGTSSLLYVQYDQRGGGKLFALSTATGNSSWVAERDTEASWSSPVLVETGGGARLVLNGNPYVICYDAASGRELWRVDCMLGDVAPSPACADGLAFVASTLAPLTAIAIEDGTIRWQNYDNVPDVSSPVASGGLVISATSYGVVSCLDAATGTSLWSREFDVGFYASPVVAGGNVYLVDRDGRTRVLAASKAYSEVELCPLGEPSDCTPAIVGNRIYLRGRSSLVCIGSGG